MDLLTILGPLPISDEPSFAALRLTGGRFAQPAIERTPEAAARRALAKGSTDVELHPHNRDLAETLGLPIAAPTQEQQRALGFFTFTFANYPTLQKITDFDLLESLLVAIQEFDELRAWERFDPMAGLPTEVKGALGQWEVMVLGGAGLQSGFVLQPPGGADRIAAASTEEEAAGQLATEAIVVYLEEEPTWPLEMLGASHGLRHWPLLRRINRGRHGVLRPDEARLLVAALRAVNEVTRTGDVETGTFEHRGKRVEITVDPEDAWSLPAAAHPAHDFDRQLVEKLLSFAADLPGFPKGWFQEGALAKAPGLEVPFSLYQRPFEGKTIARRAWEAGLLDEEEQRWVEAQEGVTTRLLEVEATDGAHVAVLDLLTGQADVILDREISQSAEPRGGLLSRLLEWEGATLAVGTLERMLVPHQAHKLRDAFREGGHEALAEPERTLQFLSLLERGAEDEEEGPAGLFTTDGDPLEMIREQYTVRGAQSVQAVVAAIPDMLDGGQGRFTWTKKGNTEHPSWRRTVLASVAVSGSTITVDTTSKPRADALAALLRDAFGDKLVSKGRKAEAFPSMPFGSAKVDSQPIPNGPWLRLLPELDLLGRAYERLGASPSPADVAWVHEELCQSEFGFSQDAEDMEEAGHHPLDIRRLVGVDWRGTWIGPDQAFAAFGGGLSLSRLLPALGMQVEEEIDLPREVFFQILCRLWNASRAPGADAAEVLDEALEERREDPTLREAFGWVLDQMRRYVPNDRRIVERHEFETTEEGYSFHATWGIDAEGLDVPKGSAPVLSYHPEDEPEPEVWLQTPLPWRRHMVASFIREEGFSFGRDFALYVDRHVEVEDALSRGTPKVLVEAFEDLVDELEIDDAINEIALHLTRHPEVKVGSRTTAALRKVLEELFEE